MNHTQAPDLNAKVSPPFHPTCSMVDLCRQVPFTAPGYVPCIQSVCLPGAAAVAVRFVVVAWGRAGWVPEERLTALLGGRSWRRPLRGPRD